MYAHMATTTATTILTIRVYIVWIAFCAVLELCLALQSLFVVLFAVITPPSIVFIWQRHSIPPKYNKLFKNDG